jgi:hypothetical protein
MGCWPIDIERCVGFKEGNAAIIRSLIDDEWWENS